MHSQWSPGPTYTEHSFNTGFISGQGFRQWPRRHHLSPSSNCLDRIFCHVISLNLNLWSDTERRAYSPFAHSCSNPALLIRHSQTVIMLHGTQSLFSSQQKNIKCLEILKLSLNTNKSDVFSKSSRSSSIFLVSITCVPSEVYWYPVC